MHSYVRVASRLDLAPGRCRVVEFSGTMLALYNVDGNLFATANECPHQGGPLGQGTLEGRVVTCPWHGWSFDVTTGVCPMNPNLALTTYSVKVEGNEIYVAL